ncbi:unnamed protein product (mitochondrion) [Enteromyxum leei]|uniref:Uncharacterized protein n=1 Tax=Enteromyxum leei TaxID=188704 RepID=A0A1Q2X875_ENTLE|nr:unnamed protein product [Enteromyxum leei]
MCFDVVSMFVLYVFFYITGVINRVLISQELGMHLPEQSYRVLCCFFHSGKVVNPHELLNLRMYSVALKVKQRLSWLHKSFTRKYSVAFELNDVGQNSIRLS